jgi:diaminohydroxyphosphoribosylaminopyrimidine deaminase / 5-amino-6-(5-phosphoribosylamino)uracil reductase
MDDSEAMDRAIALASAVRTTTSPNPWVGCVVLATDGTVFEGATQPPGGPHAEAVALAAAGPRAQGSTVVTTLEPCAHHGRTPPCADALIDAAVARVVVGVTDPDPHVTGQGIARLEAAGIATEVGVRADAVAEQLAAYLTHRRTGRPHVVLKLAATLDGRTAAADGTSQWITGHEARADAHRLRAESDAVLVGAGTVRADDPSLTVRHVATPEDRQPLRVVLGHAAESAKVQPALELTGDLGEVLDTLGDKGVLQVLVEGGPTVAAAFHRAGLVNRYVVYLAPALTGGDDGRPLFTGPGSPSIDDVWRGRIVGVTPVGDDIRIDVQASENA